VPARWDAAGHLDDGPAEVRLDAPGTYDPATKTCSGVYCHGGTLEDPAAAHPTPTWTTDGDQASCGGCHGLPPENHAGAPTSCATCHGAAFDGGALVTTVHLDGVTDLGDRSGGCGACHGDATSPAPPRALDGATATTALGVGAHRGHLARSALRGPIACNECHLVPSEIAAAAHLDGDLIAEVFPAGAGVLARDDGADPTWDRGTGTCSGVYCHGAATPRWTALGQGEAACGTCHGIPPADAFHAPTLTLTDCHDCHSPSVDPFGNIVFTGDDSEHLDGDVDF
jgi:predicted CxxxxCH...CXXCH cytochrome family protein